MRTNSEDLSIFGGALVSTYNDNMLIVQYLHIIGLPAGYLLGIQDQFNFCEDDDLEKMRDLCRHYLEKVFQSIKL